MSNDCNPRDICNTIKIIEKVNTLLINSIESINCALSEYKLKVGKKWCGYVDKEGAYYNTVEIIGDGVGRIGNSSQIFYGLRITKKEKSPLIVCIHEGLLKVGSEEPSYVTTDKGDWNYFGIDLKDELTNESFADSVLKILERNADIEKK